MRKIINRIEDCKDKSYAEIEEILKVNNLRYDGMLISMDTGTAYIWIEIKRKDMNLRT